MPHVCAQTESGLLGKTLGLESSQKFRMPADSTQALGINYLFGSGLADRLDAVVSFWLHGLADQLDAAIFFGTSVPEAFFPFEALKAAERFLKLRRNSVDKIGNAINNRSEKFHANRNAKEENVRKFGQGMGSLAKKLNFGC